MRSLLLQSDGMGYRASDNPRSPSGVCRECGARCASVALSACPECGGAIGPEDLPRAGLLSLPAMLHQNAYAWFVLVSAVDIMLTWIILVFLGGQEVNPVAAAVIAHGGLTSLVVFKFCLVLFVVVMCEWIGRRNVRVGVKLAEWSVAVSSIPVVVSLMQILAT